MGTTPVFGFPYPDPSDLVANYPALGQQLAEDVEDEIIASSGYAFINATSFTTVSSISVNNCFTSTYQNYKLVLVGNGSTPSGVNLRLRASGSDATGSNYIYQSTQASATTVSTGANTQTSFIAFFVANTTTMVGEALIARPAEASRTQVSVMSGRPDYQQFNVGAHNLSNAYDGFSLIPAAGTITGTIRVYGLKNS